MLRFIVRRLLLAIPVIFGILLVTFFLARAIPGDPCRSILGEKATEEACERFARNKGLDEPLPVQLGIYMRDIATGDLGDSIRFSRPVSQMLVERLPMTIELATAALIIAVVVGVTLGVISAMRHNSAVDVGTMVVANVGVSMPVFWLGLMLIWLFAATLGWLPPSGRLTAGLSSEPFFEKWGWDFKEGSFPFLTVEFISNHFIFNSIITGDWEVLRDALKHLILPAFALSTIPMAVIARITRSSLLEVMGKDYVRTARAKGSRERRVVIRHGLRNALLPVTTIIGLQLGALLSGAVLTETIFGLAGAGTMIFDAITARDFPVIQGFVVVIATLYVVINLIVDILYAYLDPRIRLE
ncbi:MAG: ABC transporter permease [Acidimicrobiales bacterium]|nr:ABC transporter permease [Acidimicrobiales bacterium]